MTFPPDIHRLLIILALSLIRAGFDVFGVITFGTACMGQTVNIRRLVRYTPIFTIVFFSVISIPIVHTYRLSLGFIALILMLNHYKFFNLFHASSGVLLGFSCLIALDIVFGILIEATGIPAPPESMYLRFIYSTPVAITILVLGLTGQRFVRRVKNRQDERREADHPAEFRNQQKEFATITLLFVGLIIVSTLAYTPLFSDSPHFAFFYPLMVFSLILLSHRGRNRYSNGWRGTLIDLIDPAVLGACIAYIIHSFGDGGRHYRLLFIPLVASVALKRNLSTRIIIVVFSIGFVLFDTGLSHVGKEDLLYIFTILLVFWLIRGFIEIEGSLRGTLEHYAITDPLTGMYNRRYLQAKLNGISSQEISSAFLIVLDLDNFKSINDTYGHSEGDAELKKTAELIQSMIRKEDTAARYGGDEFVILIREPDPVAALRIAQRIGKTVSRKTSRSVELGVSMGMACGADFPDSMDLIIHADKELYQAKNGGKNLLSFRGTAYTFS